MSYRIGLGEREELTHNANGFRRQQLWMIIHEYRWHDDNHDTYRYKIQ